MYNYFIGKYITITASTGKLHFSTLKIGSKEKNKLDFFQIETTSVCFNNNIFRGCKNFKLQRQN